MRIPESVGMSWLDSLGVAVPILHTVSVGASELIDTGAKDVLRRFGPPWVVKPDVAVGGKGNLGLVAVCHSLEAVEDTLANLRDRTVAGNAVTDVVIEEYIDGHERYLSVAMDESARCPVLRLSMTGGVGFDAQNAACLELQAGSDVPDHIFNALIEEAGVSDPLERGELAVLLDILTSAFRASQATLLEINPLRWTGERAVAVGIACEFDDHGRMAALGFRPQGWDFGETIRALTERETSVAAANRAEPHLPAVSFTELGDGDVALLVSGGGGSLLCFDYLVDHGVKPACYMDSSPGAGIKKRQAALAAGLSVPGIKGALVGSVVVSLASVTETAEGLLGAMRASRYNPSDRPLVVRIAGPDEEIAQRALKEQAPDVHVVGREYTLEDCCDLLIDLLRQPEKRKDDAGDS